MQRKSLRWNEVEHMKIFNFLCLFSTKLRRILKYENHDQVIWFDAANY